MDGQNYIGQTVKDILKDRDSLPETLLMFCIGNNPDLILEGLTHDENGMIVLASWKEKKNDKR